MDVSMQFDDVKLPALGVSWRHSNHEPSQLYPEYLVKLTLQASSDDRSITNNTIGRHLHVAPPPIGRLGFRLCDVIWAPYLFRGGQSHSNNVIDSILQRRSEQDSNLTTTKRRRGFGLELETVQLPPDVENDCFTHQQQFEQSIEKARRWHLMRVSDCGYGDVREVNDMYDELLKWQVSTDLYVDNAAPPTRLDLYQQIMEHIKNGKCDPRLSSDSEAIHTLNELVLGGRVEMEITGDFEIPQNQNIPKSQASPEYKSPLPPHELYHSFPPPENGHDKATDTIRLVLDGILKNAEVSNRGIAVPTVSDIGQSATSIHVHVNINNPAAWPREAVTKYGDVEATYSLLGVIFGWVVFDRVVGTHFNMPNVWRDRSFAPMFASGPEFSWNEHSWKHGTLTLQPEQAKHVKLNNIQAWFQHVHSCLQPRHDEKKEQEPPTSLFQAVFDHKVLIDTISRWNSLNLLSLEPYGTIEFRRMHATLNADFVSAYTWFCCGFVEKFSQASMWEKYLLPLLAEAQTQRLVWHVSLMLRIRPQLKICMISCVVVMILPCQEAHLRY
eukprot:scaffold253580_cov93-Cyclotella_meneghiniana.AAC.1